jgi:hypothetical protein
MAWIHSFSVVSKGRVHGSKSWHDLHSCSCGTAHTAYPAGCLASVGSTARMRQGIPSKRSRISTLEMQMHSYSTCGLSLRRPLGMKRRHWQYSTRP